MSLSDFYEGRWMVGVDANRECRFGCEGANAGKG